MAFSCAGTMRHPSPSYRGQVAGPYSMGIVLGGQMIPREREALHQPWIAKAGGRENSVLSGRRDGGPTRGGPVHEERIQFELRAVGLRVVFFHQCLRLAKEGRIPQLQAKSDIVGELSNGLPADPETQDLLWGGDSPGQARRNVFSFGKAPDDLRREIRPELLLHQLLDEFGFDPDGFPWLGHRAPLFSQFRV